MIGSALPRKIAEVNGSDLIGLSSAGHIRMREEYDPVCPVRAVAWRLELSPAAVTGLFIPDSIMDILSDPGRDHETPRLETAQTSPTQSSAADAREDRVWCQDRNRNHRTRPGVRG